MPPVAVLEIEAAQRVHDHFTVVHGPSSLRADVYLAGDDPLHAWGLAGRRQLVVDGVALALAPPEYVIVRKLEYAAQGAGDRHLRDIRRMLERAVVPIDRRAAEARCVGAGLRDAWERAQGWTEPT